MRKRGRNSIPNYLFFMIFLSTFDSLNMFKQLYQSCSSPENVLDQIKKTEGQTELILKRLKSSAFSFKYSCFCVLPKLYPQVY